MSEKPILFSGAMIRAILDGRKTQTRRIVKMQPPTDKHVLARCVSSTDKRSEGKLRWITPDGSEGTGFFPCPYGQPGDRLWVRETWRGGSDSFSSGLHYRADLDEPGAPGQWTPSIHMPRWASRISLEVKAVRVERLQDISEADAEAEGVDSRGDGSERYRAAFRLLWCEIYGHASWDANPWLWCVEFTRVQP